jgi:hypothetical protein
MKTLLTAAMRHNDYRIVMSLPSWVQTKTLIIAAVKYTTSCLLTHHKKSTVHLKKMDVQLPVQLLPHIDEPPKTATALLGGWNLSAFLNSSLSS